jgi:hypothetical protein
MLAGSAGWALTALAVRLLWLVEALGMLRPLAGEGVSIQGHDVG